MSTYLSQGENMTFYNLFNKTALLIVAATILISANAYAEPSKEETYDFISNKLTINGIRIDEFRRKMFGFVISNTKLTASIDMCSITYTDDIYDINNKIIKSSVSTTSLKDINPKTITAQQHKSSYPYAIVEISTKSKKSLIEKNVTEYGVSGVKNKSDKTHYLGLVTLDYDQATRVAKALEHLVTICGGKDELF